MTPRRLVERLEVAIGVDGGPRRLVDAVGHELVGYFGLPAIQAAERAEAVVRKVADLIAAKLVQCEALGVTATLSLIGTAGDVVAGYCYALPSDSASVATLKGFRIQTQALSAAIRALSFSQFERFCARVLVELGAAKAKITPHGGDQGIDFIGQLSLGQYHNTPFPFMKLAHDIKVSFAGQAKHYPSSSLGPDVVRELAGAIHLARSRAFSREEVDLFDQINLSVLAPLVVLLFTTGDITSGAAKLAASAGVIARNGEQIAVFLADKGVGMTQDGGGVVFRQDLFESWLSVIPIGDQ